MLSDTASRLGAARCLLIIPSYRANPPHGNTGMIRHHLAHRQFNVGVRRSPDSFS